MRLKGWFLPPKCFTVSVKRCTKTAPPYNTSPKHDMMSKGTCCHDGMMTGVKVKSTAPTNEPQRVGTRFISRKVGSGKELSISP